MLGPQAGAWPAILALAFHNAGILGRLGSEVIENSPAEASTALRSSGASRLQISLLSILPVSLPRLMVYFFYRWENCVRDATVLGMLGFISIGYFVQESRARLRYDELLFFVLLGAAIVLAGDFISALARRWIRQAT